jgi:hypothetical protein
MTLHCPNSRLSVHCTGEYGGIDYGGLPVKSAVFIREINLGLPRSCSFSVQLAVSQSISKRVIVLP